MINKFTKEFTTDFCDNNGAINWDKLVKLNSGIVQNNIDIQKK